MGQNNGHSRDQLTGAPVPYDYVTEVAAKLGYDPADVMSVRMRSDVVVVTYRDQALGGMPRSCTHHVRAA